MLLGLALGLGQRSISKTMLMFIFFVVYAYLSKSVKATCSYFVWVFTRVIMALHVSLGLATGWYQRSISRMMIIKFLVKVFRCLYF